MHLVKIVDQLLFLVIIDIGVIVALIAALLGACIIVNIKRKKNRKSGVGWKK